MALKTKDRIVVAMSGGVDSSTVAAMLHNQKYEVIGITLQLYKVNEMNQKNGTCCAGQDLYDAKIAADRIGIPHYVLNYETIFKQKVIKDFADSYIKGETPIPCIQCNQRIKFEDMLKAAKNLGAKALATGHYVRKKNRNDQNFMFKGLDHHKDQSYFLFQTTKNQLSFLEFPLGEMTKNETRKLAHTYRLNTSNKPESQDICFVQNEKYSKIINKLKPESLKQGEIIDLNGKILGIHNGIINFTIGQRKGINVNYNKPLYVIKIDSKTNRVTVGNKDKLKSTTLKVRGLNWLANKDQLKKIIYCSVKLRSNHKEVKARVEYLGKGFANVTLASCYYGITPGQACVIYDNDQVLGGGWIMR